MADLQGFIQETRQLMPYTDEEIRELYYRAQAKTNVPAVETSSPQKDTNYPDEVAADSIINSTAAGLLVWLFSGFENAYVYAFLSGLIVLASCSVLGRMDAVVGYKTLKTRREKELLRSKMPSSATNMSHSRVIDAEDPEILAVVMRFLSREPISQSERILNEISSHRRNVQDSLKDLDAVLSTLRKEISECDNDDLQLLLVSQQSAASDYSRQLTEADRVLSDQAQEAKDAVAPVQELMARIASIGRINDTLERVRAAHDVINQSHEAISTNRMELSLLAQVSNAAVARLKDLEGLVKSTQNARAELEAAVKAN